MRAGLLSHRITLQEKSVSRDEYGGEIVSWIDVGTFWANVEPLRLKEYLAVRAAQADVDLKVTMRYVAGVKADWRMMWDGAAYDIASVVDVNGRKKTLELFCRGEAQPT